MSYFDFIEENAPLKPWLIDKNIFSSWLTIFSLGVGLLSSSAPVYHICHVFIWATSNLVNIIAHVLLQNQMTVSGQVYLICLFLIIRKVN